MGASGQHQAPEDGGSLTLLRVGRIIVYFVYALAVAATVILTIAFFLRLFAASTQAPFTQWIYRSADRFMQPFRGIFPPVEGAGESVLDVSVLFGILMYGLLALGVHSLIVWINRKVYSHDLHQAPTGYATRSYGEPPR